MFTTNHSDISQLMSLKINSCMFELKLQDAQFHSFRLLPFKLYTFLKNIITQKMKEIIYSKKADVIDSKITMCVISLLVLI